MISKILISVLMTPIIYFLIAIILAIFPVKREVPVNGLDFDVLKIKKTYNISGAEQYYTARDGKKLFYRYFSSDSDKVLILIHGSGTEGRYLTALARKLSSAAKAKIVVPDLRGHGRSTLSMPGDINYIGQLEDDLSDLSKHLCNFYPEAMFLLG